MSRVTHVTCCYWATEFGLHPVATVEAVGWLGGLTRGAWIEGAGLL